MSAPRSEFPTGTLKAENPASVGALPGHGSNNPCEENAVNKQHNTTAPAGAAMPDFKSAFMDLEDPIDRAAHFIEVLDVLVTVSDEEGTDQFHGSVRSAMKFISLEVIERVREIADLHLSEYNEHVGRENDHLARQRRAS